MIQYKNAIRKILTEGVWDLNERTKIETIKAPFPIVTQYHMSAGFPALTGRRAPAKSAFGEIVGFIRGLTSAFDFRGLGCKFWDQNANENAQWLANPYRKGEDDLGDVYGAQWRRWPAYKEFAAGTMTDAIHADLTKNGWKFLVSDVGFGNEKETVIYKKEVDQLADCVRKILTNPSDRRILFHAWNPAKLDEIALPACHLLYQFVPTPATKELALSVTIRSNDMPLGYPSNVMEAAALLMFVAKITGYIPTWLTIISNDAHIYRNQLDMVNEYLERPTHDLPKLHMPNVPDFSTIAQRAHKEMVEQHEAEHGKQPEGAWLDMEKFVALTNDRVVEWLDLVDPHDFVLLDYKHEEPLSAPMAV